MKNNKNIEKLIKSIESIYSDLIYYKQHVYEAIVLTHKSDILRYKRNITDAEKKLETLLKELKRELNNES